jgi:uncharacterized membrane protein YgcG
MLAAVQGGYWRCVELLLPAYSEPNNWRRQALSAAAANGYWRILQLLLDYIENQPAQGSYLPAWDLAAAIAASRGHLRCARLLVDKVVQAWINPHASQHDPNANKDLDSCLAAAAQAGDWQMVELLTTARWPDPLLITLTAGAGVKICFGPDWTSALAAMVDPEAAGKAKKHLKAQLYPLHRQTPPNGGSGSGSGSGRAGSDGQQGHSSAVGSGHSTGGGGSGSNGAGLTSVPVGAGSSGTSPDVTEVEQERADVAEPPSSQLYTPSRSNAAVLLIRAGAKVERNLNKLLTQLAVTERNEELRELLSALPVESLPSTS